MSSGVASDDAEPHRANMVFRWRAGMDSANRKRAMFPPASDHKLERH